MSANNPLEAERKRIWSQRVWNQYEKIIAHHEFRNAKEVQRILEFLLKNELSDAPRELSQEDIWDGVFNNRGGSTSVGHKMKDLRNKLTLYYLENLDDDIIIECPKRSHRLFIQSASERGEEIITRWNQQNLYQLMRSAESGTEIRILTTLFIDGNQMLDLIVNELLPRGVNVKIVMMDPDKEELFQARFERLHFHPTPSHAKDILIKQLRTFEVLCARRAKQVSEGTIEVRRSGIMPFGFFVQCGDEMRIGLLLPITPYQQGPMIAVKTETWLGRMLEENWLGYWAYRSQSELMGIESSLEIEEVWLATPDLVNDAGSRAPFKEIVGKNAERGVKYTVIFPKQARLEPQLRELRALFSKDQTTEKHLGLTEIPVEDSAFAQLMLTHISEIPTHITIFNPRQRTNPPTDAYMEMPAEQQWRKLDGKDAETTLNKFKAIVEQQVASTET